MDDLDARLDRLLSDPNISDRLNSLLSSVTEEKKEQSAAEKDSVPDLSAAFSGVDMSDVLGLLGSFNAGAEESRLLSALSPYLRPSRQKKLEEAKTLMTLWRLLPSFTKKTEEKRE